MATAWQIIFRETAKHLNAFASGTASTVSTNYLTSPLTTTQVEDPFFNLGFIQDKCIDAHGRLALEIANVRAHPWRNFVGPSQTLSILTGAALPTTAANGKTIVGAWGQVRASSQLMSEAAPERVQMAITNSALYTTPRIYYIDGTFLYHSGALSAVINCCTYERDDAVTAVAANGNITLPDVLVDAIVAGAVAECVIESKGMDQAGYFLGIFEKAIESIRNGQTTMPMMTLKQTA